VRAFARAFTVMAWFTVVARFNGVACFTVIASPGAAPEAHPRTGSAGPSAAFFRAAG